MVAGGAERRARPIQPPDAPASALLPVTEPGEVATCVPMQTRCSRCTSCTCSCAGGAAMNLRTRSAVVHRGGHVVHEHGAAEALAAQAEQFRRTLPAQVKAPDALHADLMRIVAEEQHAAEADLRAALSLRLQQARTDFVAPDTPAPDVARAREDIRRAQRALLERGYSRASVVTS